MTTNFTMMARNRFLLTAQALTSLFGLKDATVTILDDRSDSPTRDLLQGWCGATGAHYVRNDNPIGTGPLRNLVISESEHKYGRGDYLYLSDNDVFFHPRSLEHLIHCYELTYSSGVRVLGGYNHPFHQPYEKLVLGNGSSVGLVHALALQSMLMYWEAWDKYGPFCGTPVDRVCQSEDVDMTNKIHADGFKIGVVSPALIVSTGITNTFGEKIPGWELVKAQCPAGVIIE